MNTGEAAITRIRALPRAFGVRFNCEPLFAGAEAENAWINSTALAQQFFGPPTVPLATMIDWTADWIKRDMPNNAKPTRFEVPTGRI